VKEKFFMKRKEKRLNVPSRHERSFNRQCSSLRGTTEVRSLTYVASRFISQILVRVRCNLREKDNKHERQSDSQHPSHVPPCL
jgi:hypothetical protein